MEDGGGCSLDSGVAASGGGDEAWRALGAEVQDGLDELLNLWEKV